jgi:acyl dehydratase
MIVFEGIPDLVARVGEELGTSAPLLITQEAIDAFAETTGDRYWIHVDPARAAATPFGSTIAHGLLTLSLGPRFGYELYEIRGVAMGVNYGYARVRFPAPLPVGSLLRMRATLSAVEEVPGGATVTIAQAFEREGGDKPVCVADAMLRLFSPAG